MGKRYFAVVAGRLDAPRDAVDGWALIDLPLAADWPNRPRRVVDRECGKPSQTRWRVLAYEAALDATRLELEPVTGRSHQLRVHLQAIGHPVCGDPEYGTPGLLGLERQFLHATRLAFAHPITGEPIELISPLPADLQAALSRAEQLS